MSAFLNQVQISDAKFDSLTRASIKNKHTYGVFETMLIDNSHGVQFKGRHLARLLRGVKSLQAESKAFKNLNLSKIADTFVQDIDLFKSQFYASDSRSVVIRYQLVLDENKPEKINSMLKTRSVTLPSSSKLKIKICETVLPENKSTQGRKDIDRRVYDKAVKELDGKFYEGILCNKSGHVIEGIKTNIFAIQDNVLFTPPLSQGGVAGIMRQVVIEKAQESGLNVLIAPLHYLELMKMDAVFLTNSIIGVVNVEYILRPDRKRSMNVFKPKSIGFQNILKLSILNNAYL